MPSSGYFSIRLTDFILLNPILTDFTCFKEVGNRLYFLTIEWMKFEYKGLVVEFATYIAQFLGLL